MDNLKAKIDHENKICEEEEKETEEVKHKKKCKS
jgi:hypothetical protein